MELMTIEGTAEFFKTTKAVVKGWMHKEILPKEITVKVGRRRYFIKSKLEEFLMNKIPDK